MREIVILLLMAGEDNFDDDLAARERQAAEDRAFELNPYGTGVDPDMHLGYDYNYDESPELTDVDFQPGNDDFSSDFTNYAGSDPYADQFGNDDDEDDENEDQEDFDSFDDYDDDDDDDYDDDDDDDDDDYDEDDYGDFDYDDEDDEEDNDDDDDDGDDDGDDDDGGEDGAAAGDEGGNGKKGKKGKKGKRGKKGKKGKQGKKGKKKQNEGKTKEVTGKSALSKWMPGMPITVKLLDDVWQKLKLIDQVKPMIDAANKALKSAMQVSSNGAVMTLYQKTKGADDVIGALLKLANSKGKRMALGVGAVLEALADQQWAQVAMLFTLPTVLNGLLAVPQVKSVLTTALSVAKPILEKKATAKG